MNEEVEMDFLETKEEKACRIIDAAKESLGLVKDVELDDFFGVKHGCVYIWRKRGVSKQYRARMERIANRIAIYCDKCSAEIGGF